MVVMIIMTDFVKTRHFAHFCNNLHFIFDTFVTIILFEQQILSWHSTSSNLYFTREDLKSQFRASTLAFTTCTNS